MKKGGLTVELLEVQLRKHRGNLAAAGRHFGVGRSAVSNFISRHPELKAIADDVRESMKDSAEAVLQTKVLKGEAWAVCFYLKTQAKDRGYVEASELRHGIPVELESVECVVRTREEAKDFISRLPEASRVSGRNGTG